jgi:hypothetical protein
VSLVTHSLPSNSLSIARNAANVASELGEEFFNAGALEAFARCAGFLAVGFFTLFAERFFTAVIVTQSAGRLYRSTFTNASQRNSAFPARCLYELWL